MSKEFYTDEWTKSFCLIFKELTDKHAIKKKGRFAESVGITQPSTLTQILKGNRNFPLEKRQQALTVLKDTYYVNVEYFKSRHNPMFTREVEEEKETPIKTGMTYSEIIECQKLRVENEFLKNSLRDKDIIIQTQAALIKQLQATQ